MNLVKEASLAYVKSTGEPCFVLEIRKATESPEYTLNTTDFSGMEAVVRMPQQGEGGIQHVTEIFLLEELETDTQRFDRECESMLKLQSRAKEKSKVPEAVAVEGFIPN